MISQETIVALASPSGAGAIAVIRISGNDAITIASQVFQSVSGKDITKQKETQEMLNIAIELRFNNN